MSYEDLKVERWIEKCQDQGYINISTLMTTFFFRKESKRK